MSIDQIGGTGNVPGLPAASSAAAANAGSVAASSGIQTSRALKPIGEAKPSEPTAEQVKDAAEEVQKAVSPVAQELLFSVDRDTGKTVVKVMDTETQKVIRQIPSEEMLAMAQQLDKLHGLLVKQKA